MLVREEQDSILFKNGGEGGGKGSVCVWRYEEDSLLIPTGITSLSNPPSSNPPFQKKVEV